MKTNSLPTALFGLLLYSSLFLFPINNVLLAQTPPTTLDLRIIVVDSSTKADHLLQRLKAGEDFATLARELSIDPTASDGGYMGRVDPSTLRSELRNALKKKNTVCKSESATAISVACCQITLNE